MRDGLFWLMWSILAVALLWASQATAWAISLRDDLDIEQRKHQRTFARFEELREEYIRLAWKKPEAEPQGNDIQEGRG